MSRIFLQDMIADLRFEDLPPNWNSFDLGSFSQSKRLWDYQQEAAKNAIKVLCRYFQGPVDYQGDERIGLNRERKQRFYRWYQENGLEEHLAIKLDKRKRGIYNLLTEYYPGDHGGIPYEHFINRLCFWMATGSGKTLVIIKLIQVLKALIDRGEIPRCDILVLTHRDDLTEQFKKLVGEFNYANNGCYIRLRELKEYPEVKRHQVLFRNEEITVFYYRSDNLSDEQKEKIIDFRNYDNEGKWYIFLDEAHKGDREESKRQHIYSILSRNGFLFNSSATFIDQKDFRTCAYEFNLSSFINAGYGKHIAILKQEIRAFREDENYSDEEKQKIVLKSLILLTYVKKFYEETVKIREKLYHNPLLLTLVNSVNVEDADLKLFFHELERIGKGDIEEGVFEKALDELWEELRLEPEFMFENGNRIQINETIFRSISKEDVLGYVYNSKTGGGIEVSFRPSDKRQVAFKLITSDKHFALMKTGDMPTWLKDQLSRFNVNHQFEEEGFFERINQEDSPINLLMGSRSFYEGWDSNRPNVINFINIGLGEDARKFILQSVGRGIRIEPIKDKRRRLLPLYNAKKIDGDLFSQLKSKALPQALPIETLFIFATNRKALETVIGELEKERRREDEHQLPLFVINPQAEAHKLLVPVYEDADHPILVEKERVKDFPISDEDLTILKKFAQFVLDDRVLLMRYETEPAKIELLRRSLSEESNFKSGEQNFKNIDLLIRRVFDYFDVVPEEFERIKELEEEIRHFKSVRVSFEDVRELEEKIERVKNYPSQVKELQQQYGKISPQEYLEKAKNLKDEEDFEASHKRIKIKYVANHYYVPLVLSLDDKVDYIKHVIKTGSEARFINNLEKYLAKSPNRFKQFDWWMFSKLDESLDEIYIPYYNPNVNKFSDFHPDFIFWLLKNGIYSILFVDPKGIEHISGWVYKIDNGYKRLFEENGSKRLLSYNGLKVEVDLKFRTDDLSKVPAAYRQYWFDDIGKMLEAIG